MCSLVCSLLRSDGQVQTQGDMMLVPINVLDRWLERFHAKFARDPNFMLKPHD